MPLINAKATKAGGAFGVSIWCPDLATPTTVDGSAPPSGGANELQGNAVNSTTSMGIGMNLQVLTDVTGQIALQRAAATIVVSIGYLAFIDTPGR